LGIAALLQAGVAYGEEVVSQAYLDQRLLAATTSVQVKNPAKEVPAQPGVVLPQSKPAQSKEVQAEYIPRMKKGLKPNQFIVELFNDIQGTLSLYKASGSKSRKKLFDLTQKIVAPYIDFEKMSKQILGKYWKKITPDQRARFMTAFRYRISMAMVSTYKHDEDYSMELKGSRANKKNTRAIVKTKMVEKSTRKAFALVYKLILNDGFWQVYDVAINGVSVLHSFKSASATEIRARGIDSLIDQLKEQDGEHEEEVELEEVLVVPGEGIGLEELLVVPEGEEAGTSKNNNAPAGPQPDPAAPGAAPAR